MTAADDLRPLLFGRPIDEWPPAGGDAGSGPWAAFAAARRHLADGDQDLAVRCWAGVAQTPGAEPRHVLQAWTFLRSIGVAPDAATVALEVLGVVAEVAMDQGHDVLAAYADGSVRYLHHHGGVTVVEPGAASEAVATAVADLLASGRALAPAIGTWAEPDLPPLPSGHTRFTLLTPGGPRFGQGPDAVLADEAMAQPLYATATALLVAVVDLTT